MTVLESGPGFSEGVEKEEAVRMLKQSITIDTYNSISVTDRW